MSQRSSTFYNLINNPYIYKSIQKIMSGTSEKKIIQTNIKKKLKYFRYWLWPREIDRYS